MQPALRRSPVLRSTPGKSARGWGAAFDAVGAMHMGEGAAKVSQTVKDIGGDNATFTRLEDRELCSRILL